MELYDYDTDPGELTNLADDYPEVAAEFMDAVEPIIYLVANPD